MSEVVYTVTGWQGNHTQTRLVSLGNWMTIAGLSYNTIIGRFSFTQLLSIVPQCVPESSLYSFIHLYIRPLLFFHLEAPHSALASLRPPLSSPSTPIPLFLRLHLRLLLSSSCSCSSNSSNSSPFCSRLLHHPKLSRPLPPASPLLGPPSTPAPAPQFAPLPPYLPSY